MSIDRSRWYYKAFLYLVDTVAAFSWSAEKKPGDKKRILIVRPDGIGDFILFTAALRGVRELFPPETHEITVVADVSLSEIASSLELVDEVILVNRKSFLEDPFYRWKLMRLLRLSNFAVSINPVFSRAAMIDDAMIRVTRSPERIAWEGSLDNISGTVKRFTNHWYSRLVSNVDPFLMELRRNEQFVRDLGLKDFKTSLPGIAVRNSWNQHAEELLDKTGISGPYCVILPGTGLPPEKAWPTERFGELASLVVKNGIGDVLVCGGADDRDLGRRVVKTSRSERVFDLTGQTPLEVLAALMGEAVVVVGSDTGGVHLAAAVGGKAISIIGGAFPGRFFPYEVDNESRVRGQEKTAGLHIPVVVKSTNQCQCPDWSCTRSDWSGGTFPCISEVEVDEVFGRVKEVCGLRISSSQSIE